MSPACSPASRLSSSAVRPFDIVEVTLQKNNAEVHGIMYRYGLHCAARILKMKRYVQVDFIIEVIILFMQAAKLIINPLMFYAY
ncbi:hypothetical protein Dimus_035222 [Dionaea muscipula]